MAVRTLSQRLSGQSFEAVAVVGRRLGGRFDRRHPEQFPATLKLAGTMAIAEEAVVSNAVKSIRQHMDQEAANELLSGKGHRLLAIVIPVVLPLETNLAAVHGHQPVIGDGDTVGIAADIVENLSGSGKGPLRIDDPCDRRSPG